MIVTDDRVVEFVARETGLGLCPPYTCVGYERDGEIIVGAVFNCFHYPDIHMTAAGTEWPRAFLRALGDYCFRQLECERVTFVTEQEHVVRLLERVGGQAEGRLRNRYGPGRDGWIIGVLASEYRYLPRPRN